MSSNTIRESAFIAIVVGCCTKFYDSDQKISLSTINHHECSRNTWSTLHRSQLSGSCRDLKVQGVLRTVVWGLGFSSRQPLNRSHLGHGGMSEELTVVYTCLSDSSFPSPSSAGPKNASQAFQPFFRKPYSAVIETRQDHRDTSDNHEITWRLHLMF
jgi:hypothetical protein